MKYRRIEEDVEEEKESINELRKNEKKEKTKKA